MKFSIITVCYNNRDGLENTIKSVICQTYKDYEFIVIDGGSKDGTKELLEQYDDQIDFWCSEPDKGIYNAMNKGVTHAHGDYAIFMNSGDIFFDEDVLKKIDALKCEQDIIAGLVERMDDHQTLFRHDKDIFTQIYRKTLCHQGSFIKRTLLEKFPYDESLRAVSDWKFWLDTIIYNNVSYLQIDIYVAKQDMTGLSCTSNVGRMEREKILNEYFPSRLRTHIDKLYTPTYYNYLYLEEKSKPLSILYRKLLSLTILIIKKFDKNK